MQGQLRVFAVADDLTGSLEVGAKFAAEGFESKIACDPLSSLLDTEVFVIDTESRHLSPARAQSTVHEAALRAVENSPLVVYKKTDSTLRGHISAELTGLMAAFPGRELLYAPAYPAMGRVVRNGELYVDGLPVHRTAFASDRLNPVRSSRVQDALGDLRATILDGETDDHVLEAAERILASTQPLIVAGPASIAGAIARILPDSGAKNKLPSLKTCLVVNGSMHPASDAQIAYARDRGLFDADWQLYQYPGHEEGVARAVRLGESVKRRLNEHPVEGVVVFGGDTAYGLHSAFTTEHFLSAGEVLPGVPMSKSGGLYWITKAGGFGTPNLIEELQRICRYE